MMPFSIKRAAAVFCCFIQPKGVGISEFDSVFNFFFIMKKQYSKKAIIVAYVNNHFIVTSKDTSQFNFIDKFNNTKRYLDDMFWINYQEFSK